MLLWSVDSMFCNYLQHIAYCLKSHWLGNMGCYCCEGEHQYELLDFVAAKFYEEPGVFKLLVRLPLYAEFWTWC